MRIQRVIFTFTMLAAAAPLWGQQGGGTTGKNGGSTANVVLGEGGGMGGGAGPGKGKGGEMGACQDDTTKFCADQRAKGREAAHACLRKHLKELSPLCAKKLKASKPHSKKAKASTASAPSTLPPPASTGQ